MRGPRVPPAADESERKRTTDFVEKIHIRRGGGGAYILTIYIVVDVVKQREGKRGCCIVCGRDGRALSFTPFNEAATQRIKDGWPAFVMEVNGLLSATTWTLTHPLAAG